MASAFEPYRYWYWTTRFVMFWLEKYGCFPVDPEWTLDQTPDFLDPTGLVTTHFQIEQ